MKKQAHQQPLERFDRDLNFMGKLGVSEQDAGQQCAKCHGKTGGLGERSDPEHGEQGQRHKDFRLALMGQLTKDWRDQGFANHENHPNGEH